MTIRAWAIKRSELKPLSRSGLILFAVRCALRVEPWVPMGTVWRDGLRIATDGAFAEPTAAKSRSAHARAVSDEGARHANRLHGTASEDLGRCANYATSTLAIAVEMNGETDAKKLVDLAMAAAKHAGSIGPVRAHAGRIVASNGTDVVALVATAAYDAMRGDIGLLVTGTARVEKATDRVKELRALGPLWPDGPPAWSAP